jgi:glutamate 5-kinase
MAITDGHIIRPLQALRNGANATWFAAQGDPQAARKRWIAAMKTRAHVTVDAGAERALGQGKSLLPAGVIDVVGPFDRGDPIAIRNEANQQIGIGLARYTAAEAKAILGKRSDRIEEILGYPGRAALIHRDDMVL